MTKYIQNNLRIRRKMMGYSLKQSAFLLGLKNTSMLIRWERGVCAPSFDNLLSLAVIYGTAVDSLYIDHRNILRLIIKERHQLLFGSPTEPI
jgi:transcriptional regulator with XRE-family HTH domain